MAGSSSAGSAGCSLSSLEELVAVASDAALVNIGGHLTHHRLMRAFRRRVTVDVDPGFTQFWHDAGLAGAHVRGHDAYVTIGELIGTSRPALIRDTGFSHTLPVGDGLVAFATLEQAVAGAADIADRYPEHREARDGSRDERLDTRPGLVRFCHQAGIG